MKSLRAFLDDETGNVTLEVLIIFLPVIGLVVGIFELGVSLYFILSAQKSAQLGARIAATRSPVFVELPVRNEVNIRWGAKGDACFQPDGTSDASRDACLDPGGPFVCTAAGGSLSSGCDEDRFEAILTEMRQVTPSLRAEDVAITYRASRLGFAGGPFVPFITVTVLPRPSPFNFVLLRWDFTNNSDGDIAPENVTILRGVSASSFGEDMDSTETSEPLL